MYNARDVEIFRTVDKTSRSETADHKNSYKALRIVTSANVSCKYIEKELEK